MLGLLLLAFLVGLIFAFNISFRTIIRLSRSSEELNTSLQHLEDEISDMEKVAGIIRTRAEKPDVLIEVVHGTQTRSETGTGIDLHSASHVIESSSFTELVTVRDVRERGRGETQPRTGELESRSKAFRLHSFRRIYVWLLILQAIGAILLAFIFPIFVVHIWCNKKGGKKGNP